MMSFRRYAAPNFIPCKLERQDILLTVNNEEAAKVGSAFKRITSTETTTTTTTASVTETTTKATSLDMYATLYPLSELIFLSLRLH